MCEAGLGVCTAEGTPNSAPGLIRDLKSVDFNATTDHSRLVTESKSQDFRALFGKRLREIRISRGLSQEALAFEAKLDRTYVSSCERGQRNISLENIHRLARALRVSPAAFFECSDKSRSNRRSDR